MRKEHIIQKNLVGSYSFSFHGGIRMKILPKTVDEFLHPHSEG